MGTIYLLHFDKPIHHARHYLGYTDLSVGERLARHRSGQGSKLMAALKNNGIDFKLVRTWQGDYELEKWFKKQKNNPKFCPICNNPLMNSGG